MATNFQQIFLNPNPNPNSSPSMAAAAAPSSLSHFSSSIRFNPLHPHHNHRTSFPSLSASPKGLGTRFLSLHRRIPENFQLVASLEASNEDSKHAEINVEEGKGEVEVGVKESEEEWERILESFKEKAIKVQGISQEAYELYRTKAMVILKETSEKLKIQADKAGHDLSIVANEISQEGREYLSAAAKKSPEEMKDILETFSSSSDDFKELSKVRDFHLGIPYGAILSLLGFLTFMITGSISAIRFGVILGGTLLALSISSLRSWKRGKRSILALNGQAAIAIIIFLRELKLLSQRPSFTSLFPTLISGAMAVFYLYRIRVHGDKDKGPGIKHGAKN